MHEDPQSPSNSSDETSELKRQAIQGLVRGSRVPDRVRPVKSSQAAEKSDVRHRQYCTQACLLGLVRKNPLDDACPNINAHHAHVAGNHHASGLKSLAKLVSRQLTM